jgi:hypothetical protein
MDHVKTGYKDANCVKLAGYRIQWYAFAVVVVVVVVGMMIMKLDIIRW